MKINKFMLVISIFLTVVFVYLVYVVNRNEALSKWEIIVPSAAFLITGIGMLSVKGDEYITNLRILSGVFFVLFFMISIVFGFASKTEKAIPFFIIINSILLILYLIFANGLMSSSKQKK